MAWLILCGLCIFSQHQNNIHWLVCWFAMITNNYWARLSEISWFVSYEQINYLQSWRLRQIIIICVCNTLTNHDILQWPSSIIIAVLSFDHHSFDQLNMSNHSQPAWGIDPPFSRKSIVSIIINEQNIICSETLICRQLFAGHMVSCQLMKRTEKYMLNDNNFYYDQIELL